MLTGEEHFSKGSIISSLIILSSILHAWTVTKLTGP